MRVAVSASVASLDSQVDARFGRCPYFVVADPSTMEFDSVENPGGASAQGAGIVTAQMIADKGVEAVLTGNCGPNAYQTLNAAGVQVITGISGTVREALQAYNEGKYRATDAPNVGSHFGMSAPGAMGRGMGGDTASIPQEQPPPQQDSSLVGLLKELQGQLDHLRTQVQDINERIDDLHGKD